MIDSKKLASPSDPHQLVKLKVDISSSGIEDSLTTEDGRNLAAVMLGRMGGLKGGRARANILTSERRTEIARKAAKKRWENKRNG